MQGEMLCPVLDKEIRTHAPFWPEKSVNYCGKGNTWHTVKTNLKTRHGFFFIFV